MRIQYKGGVWKNSEDEILKAAVMKYGMNQWARIASLLVRKSAKQCKARWFEWLDPSIKKTAWTRDEEERLLHLAKIMPTQWRTIAPMIGRTATQCLEHYERLLDQAQRGGEPDESGGASGSAAGGSAAGAARARDTDFAAESKPARPDPVDMDEEELEMLSEARARLANTKGKKAKRKAREKQLEAAKRIAHLQKRRELKAAGISMKPRRRDRTQPDLAVEIPFMRAPPPGFYDVREETAQAASMRTDVGTIGRRLDKYEGRQHDVEEARARRKDEQRRRLYEEKNPAAALGLEPDPAEAVRDVPALYGAALKLPKPQVSDAELESIAKAGALFANKAKSISQNGITDSLVPDRNPVLATPSSIAGGMSSVGSTPRTMPSDSWANARQREVETIINLQNTDTPLMGGQNTPIPSSITSDPSTTPAQRTPNPLSTPSELSTLSTSSRYKKSQKLKLAMLKKTVQDGLDKLAKPKEISFESYSIEIGEDEEVEEATDLAEDVEMEEDVEDEEKRLRKEGQASLKRARRKALSSAAKRKLPLPDENWVKSGVFDAESLQLILLRDIAVTKVLEEGANGHEAATALLVQRTLKEFPDINAAHLRQARALVRKEAESGKLDKEDILKALEKRDTQPAEEWVVRGDGTVCQVSTDQDRAKALADMQVFATSAQKSQAKLGKKIEKLTKGFEKRLQTAEKQVVEEWDKIADLEMQIACVEALEEKEKQAIDRRVSEWEDKVREQVQLNSVLQKEYEDLMRNQKS